MLYPLSYGRMMKFSLRLNVTPLPPIGQITWLQPLCPRITTIPVIQVGAAPTTSQHHTTPTRQQT